VVLLGQPPVRRLDLLYVRLRCYSQEPGSGSEEVLVLSFHQKCG
jgi:hypothetical protein